MRNNWSMLRNFGRIHPKVEEEQILRYCGEEVQRLRLAACEEYAKKKLGPFSDGKQHLDSYLDYQLYSKALDDLKRANGLYEPTNEHNRTNLKYKNLFNIVDHLHFDFPLDIHHPPISQNLASDVGNPPSAGNVKLHPLRTYDSLRHQNQDLERENARLAALVCDLTLTTSGSDPSNTNRNRNERNPDVTDTKWKWDGTDKWIQEAVLRARQEEEEWERWKIEEWELGLQTKRRFGTLNRGRRGSKYYWGSFSKGSGDGEVKRAESAVDDTRDRDKKSRDTVQLDTSLSDGDLDKPLKMNEPVAKLLYTMRAYKKLKEKADHARALKNAKMHTPIRQAMQAQKFIKQLRFKVDESNKEFANNLPKVPTRSLQDPTKKNIARRKEEEFQHLIIGRNRIQQLIWDLLVGFALRGSKKHDPKIQQNLILGWKEKVRRAVVEYLERTYQERITQQREEMNSNARGRGGGGKRTSLATPSFKAENLIDHVDVQLKKGSVIVETSVILTSIGTVREACGKKSNSASNPVIQRKDLDAASDHIKYNILGSQKFARQLTKHVRSIPGIKEAVLRGKVNLILAERADEEKTFSLGDGSGDGFDSIFQRCLDDEMIKHKEVKYRKMKTENFESSLQHTVEEYNKAEEKREKELARKRKGRIRLPNIFGSILSPRPHSSAATSPTNGTVTPSDHAIILEDDDTTIPTSHQAGTDRRKKGEYHQKAVAAPRVSQFAGLTDSFQLVDKKKNYKQKAVAAPRVSQFAGLTDSFEVVDDKKKNYKQKPVLPPKFSDFPEEDKARLNRSMSTASLAGLPELEDDINTLIHKTGPKIPPVSIDKKRSYKKKAIPKPPTPTAFSDVTANLSESEQSKLSGRTSTASLGMLPVLDDDIETLTKMKGPKPPTSILKSPPVTSADDINSPVSKMKTSASTRSNSPVSKLPSTPPPPTTLEYKKKHYKKTVEAPRMSKLLKTNMFKKVKDMVKADIEKEGVSDDEDLGNNNYSKRGKTVKFYEKFADKQDDLLHGHGLEADVEKKKVLDLKPKKIVKFISDASVRYV